MGEVMKQCIKENCSRLARSRGLCNSHYTQLLRQGPLKSLYDHKGYDELDGIKDTRPGHRGSLAVNIVNDIKYKAVKRGKIWNLTHPEAFKLIKSPCTYCCFMPTWPENRVGIDRVDNSKGYDFSNCVPCCFTCNSAKGEMSLDEFKSWIARTYSHYIKK